MLIKVISGGQTGADIAGLRMAKAAGLETGGYMTKGFRTLNGYRPEYKSMYNMIELPAHDYPTRTRKNVQESDATLRFAKKWDSPGEICTSNACWKYFKRCLDVTFESDTSSMKVADWIEDNKIEVLNIAGNSEQTTPGIEEWVEVFLSRVFTHLQGRGYVA